MSYPTLYMCLKLNSLEQLGFKKKRTCRRATYYIKKKGDPNNSELQRNRKSLTKYFAPAKVQLEASSLIFRCGG